MNMRICETSSAYFGFFFFFFLSGIISQPSSSSGSRCTGALAGATSCYESLFACVVPFVARRKIESGKGKKKKSVIRCTCIVLFKGSILEPCRSTTMWP